MDENSKDIISVIAKRTVQEVKNEFCSMADSSPLLLGFGMFGLFVASWTMTVIVFLLYLVLTAYCEYKSFMDEIKFDTLQAEQESKAAVRESTESSSEVKPDDGQN